MLIDAWDPFVGGGQVHVKALLKYLPKYRIKVTLFHAPHHHIIIRAIWCLWVIPQIILAHQRNHFDLIHAHAFAPGIPAKTLSLLLGLPVIYTVHGSHLMDLNRKGMEATLERWLLTQIHYNREISVTKSFLNYSNVNKNISVISNGLDIGAFNKVKVKKNKQFTLLFVGRDHPTKGLPILLTAFSQVKKQYPQIKLQLVTGQITGTDLIKTYKLVHAFVLPSLVEGQPLVLLEAWAAKLPVIATKTAGVTEIATPKEAILVKPGSIQELSQAIIKLVTMSPDAREKLAFSGYQKAKQFTWEKTSQHTARLYRQVLNRS